MGSMREREREEYLILYNRLHVQVTASDNKKKTKRQKKAIKKAEELRLYQVCTTHLINYLISLSERACVIGY